MLSKLGKSKSKNTDSLDPPSDSHASRSTTPTPSNYTDDSHSLDDDDEPPRTGMLSIRVIAAKNLSIPSSHSIPPSVQRALSSNIGQAVASVSPSSIHQERLAKKHEKHPSFQRKNAWFMPYLVLEYEVNQVLVDSLGGSDLYNPVYMYQAQFDVSRRSQVSLQIYLRSNEQGDMGDDIFMGGVKFVPNLSAPGSTDGWYEILGGTGEVQIGYTFKPNTVRPLARTFSIHSVMQVRKRDTGRIYALKTLRKAHIASRNEITHTLAERFVLARVTNPFIVPLKFSFQSAAKLYLVLAFVNGGELFHHLQRETRFNEERSRFYCAELLLALEHLHEFNVVYRDLKPENILLDWTGHLALCDFGLCKLDMTDDKTTNTFCGTPEYLSPEIICGLGYTKSIDWWTLGILLYEMMSGLPPFYDENTDKMYKKIVKNPLTFTDDFGPEARSLITGLLNRDPSQRLGAGGADEIKRHPFFAKHIDFKKLLAKRIQPPFKPNVASAIDTANFDTVFTSEAPLDSVVDGSHLSETVQLQFAGFSYDGTNMPNRSL
ncbi:Pkinase-domain-containing protein [Sistotremastrum niveocremeum HHB9708]|uniref:Pkinase-domain-containing protein n=1 Tax=Sistotremastrum niveocremeum HHB9708 TaxID=1314777 RepID=A0A164UZ68_9AGAM|nr:Pkinase-domain-containing protein [Sistotremastrum niveocremeum HHB9708]